MAHEQDLPETAVLLRYMSFAKFVAMLSSHTLHLCRLDKLGDKDRFEGSLPRGARDRLVQELIAQLERDPPAELIEARKRWSSAGRTAEWQAEAQVRAYTLALRGSTYVSCWSQGPESEAMWRLYCEGHEGVAMLTTLQKLRTSLARADVLIEPVRYIDYQRESLPGRDYIQQLVHKRIAFVHEREVRVLHRPGGKLHIPLPGEEPPPPGDSDVHLAWDPERALSGVVVSPFAPEWYPAAVRAVVEAFAPKLADRLALSELRADPVY
jgi:hypothetical protein